MPLKRDIFNDGILGGFPVCVLLDTQQFRKEVPYTAQQPFKILFNLLGIRFLPPGRVNLVLVERVFHI